MLIRYPNALTPDTAEAIQTRVTTRHAGPTNAWRTMVIDQGADVTLLGSNMRDAAFVDLQAAGENRIAAAAGVPGIVVGLREGLQAATYSNYAQAMRRFADLTMRPLWRSAAASLAKLVMVPAGARLWYDTTDIAALREGETERAQTASVNATAMSTLIASGFTPQSVISAITAGDLALLSHTGLVSVQLQAPGSEPPTPEQDAAEDAAEPQDDEEPA
jgi:phage portal protein BeeE